MLFGNITQKLAPAIAGATTRIIRYSGFIN